MMHELPLLRLAVRANVITRAIGVCYGWLRLDTRVGQVMPFDHLLLCSPGLTKTLDTVSIHVVPERGAAAAASRVDAFGA